MTSAAGSCAPFIHSTIALRQSCQQVSSLELMGEMER
jgi:hypothetical protein